MSRLASVAAIAALVTLVSPSFTAEVISSAHALNAEQLKGHRESHHHDGVHQPPPLTMMKTAAGQKRSLHKKKKNRQTQSMDGSVIIPSNSDRSLVCPVRYAREDIPADYLPMTADFSLRTVPIDTTTIPRVLPALADYFNNTVVILIRRDAKDGTPYFKYLTANANTYDDPRETWSSSKIFAAMNGAGTLREKCPSSSSLFSSSSSSSSSTLNLPIGGLNDFIDGKKGRTPLGDLVSVICNYEEEFYTSNGLANWFEIVGGRQRMNNIIKKWLNSNTSEDSSLGGAYGMPPPSDLLSYKFYPPTEGCAITPDATPSTTISNTISALQAAELTKRIAFVREFSSSTNSLEKFIMPSTRWEDTEVLFYGAQPGTSVLFPNASDPIATFGGMASCEFPINTFGIDLNKMNALSGGKWRAFGKDGYGCSSRNVEERLFNGYACYPFEKEDEGKGKGAAISGVEFIYSTRLSVPGCSENSEALVETAAAMLNKAIIDGLIV